MRILQVIPYYYPAWSFGGPPRVAQDISMGLAQRGHDVTCFTTNALDFHNNLKSQHREYVFNKVRVRYFRNVLRLNRVFISPGIVTAASKEIKEYDVVHLHEYRSFQNAVTAYFAWKNKVPYVIQPHSSMSNEDNSHLKYIFDITVGHRILRNADKLIALNRAESKRIQKLGFSGDKVVVIPNGLDVSMYAKLPSRGSFRRKHSIREEDRLVLYLGRIYASKGLDLLIRAFRIVHEKNRDARLVLIGPDDGYKSTLERHAQDLLATRDVIFTGFASEEEKMAALVDCDVFVTPMFSGFPMSFLEAGIVGVPIVTTDKGDKLDWMNDACLVTRYDVDSLSDSIHHLLDNEKYANELGQSAKRAVSQHFDIRRIVDKIEELYQEIVT